MFQYFKTAKTAKAANSQSGIAILYTVLVSSVVIMLGASIVGITLRQLDLVISSELSTRAFYAADTGLECALYWDRRQNAFAGGRGSVSCAGAEVSVSSNGGGTYTFQLNPQNNGASVCADITLQKDGDTTRIESRGFNSCVASNRQAERALRSQY